VLERDFVGDGESVFLDDARRDANEFRVGAIVEEKVVAEILLVVEAEEAGVAGRGVERENAVAEREFGDAFADLDNGSSEFVTEEAVECKHLCVVAAAVDFEVGAAGEGRSYAENQFTRVSDRDGDVFDAQIFLAAKNSGSHGAAVAFGRSGLICCNGHLFIFSSLAPVGTASRIVRPKRGERASDTLSAA
jgi:hypothetical protein